MQAGAKIFALEQPSGPIFGAQPDDLLIGERVEPIGIVADFGFLRVEQLEYLIEIRFRVGLYLFGLERRTGFGLSSRVAYESGEAADQENRDVTLVLKVLELAQDDGMAEMQIGRSRIDAELDA